MGWVVFLWVSGVIGGCSFLWKRMDGIELDIFHGGKLWLQKFSYFLKIKIWLRYNIYIYICWGIFWYSIFNAEYRKDKKLHGPHAPIINTPLATMQFPLIKLNAIRIPPPCMYILISPQMFTWITEACSRPRVTADSLFALCMRYRVEGEEKGMDCIFSVFLNNCEPSSIPTVALFNRNE